MANINDTTNSVAALGLALPQKTADKGGELGQAEFFNLMIAQLSNQDPLKPLDSGEFLSQVAQFSQLTGIQDMSRSVDLLASSLQSSQALQASTLVGRDVSVAGNRLQLDADGEPASGAVLLPAASGAVKVTISDPSGAPVRTIALGDRAAGTTGFSWDGRDERGEPARAGYYSVRAEATLDGTPLALETLVDTRVESVTLERKAGGMTLNLKGVGAVSLNDVRQIY